MARIIHIYEKPNKMTLKSALEDLSKTTLGALADCLKRLEYLGGLRKLRGAYWHWGFSKVHGEAAAKKAFHEAHRAAISEVLSTPLRTLLQNAESSSNNAGIDPQGYLESLGQAELLPENPGAGSARHLNSVLHALLRLERNRKLNAIHRVLTPPPPPGQSLPHPEDTAGSAAPPVTKGEAEE
jgi:hypothetical protein